VNVDDLYAQVRRAMPAQPGAAVEASVHPVAPGIRVLALRTPTLPPAAHTNAYLVGPAGDHGEQLLVDPGSPYEDEQAVLDRALADEAAAGRPVAAIALTHHHGDHVGGAMAAAARWRVPIYAHAATARRLAGRVQVDRELADDDELFGVVALHTPGHAEGHLCFESAAAGAIIAGDMVASVGTILIDPDEGDMGLYLSSLARLRARAPAMLLPAHGAPIADGRAKLDEYVAHRLMREARVVAALASRRDASPGGSGVSIDELVPDVYSDTPRALWPLAARSLRAHVDKLVREARARVVAADRFAAHTL
jgi:glyoxylase-like metal-dependent hydrolase (beta-lactamase superfamily II)